MNKYERILIWIFVISVLLVIFFADMNTINGIFAFLLIAGILFYIGKLNSTLRDLRKRLEELEKHINSQKEL